MANATGNKFGTGNKDAKGPAEPKPPTREDLDAALRALPGDQNDPEYVVSSMRRHFGELFTADDETKVRLTVIVPPAEPNMGLQPSDLQASGDLSEGNITSGMQSSLSGEQQAQLAYLNNLGLSTSLPTEQSGQALAPGYWSVNKGFIRAGGQRVTAKVVGNRYYFNPTDLGEDMVKELERCVAAGLMTRVDN